jgi:protein SCO1
MRWLFFRYALLLLPAALMAEGEGSLRMPKELEQAEIEDKAGARLPLDVVMTNQDGKIVTLADYFSSSDKRPVILTLGYYGCPMLCSLVLNGLLEGLKGISFKPGQDYRLISVSIDAREKPDLAHRKRGAYLASLNAPLDVDWWQFHVADAEASKRLAQSVGFNYSYDKKTDQFAHGAGFFVITPDGVLSRTLFGISYKPTDIKLALSEASDGKIGSFIDRVILSCFHYNPDSHRYGIYIMGVMRLGAMATVLILGIVLLMYFRGERKRINSVV